ncbi:MAG: hypothetical protein AB1424_09320 [Thermodesulfobacteriota bacterium]
MTSIPLQLENHFFTKVLVEANPAFKPEDDENKLVEIHTQVELAPHRDDPRKWQVILTVGTQFDDARVPYKIELQAVGFFKVAPEVDEKKMPFLVHANGAAILYSSAREFLLLITCRGPWGGFYLPTTNFLEPPQKVKEKESKQTALPTKTASRKRVPKAKKILN